MYIKFLYYTYISCGLTVLDPKDLLLEEHGPGEAGLDATEQRVRLGVEESLVLGKAGQHARHLCLSKPGELRQKRNLPVNLT